MALDLLPASMLKAIDLLPDAKTPVTLFTRHSIREVVAGQGLAGYDLQLTSQGRDLAQAWGTYLIEKYRPEYSALYFKPNSTLCRYGSFNDSGVQIPVRLPKIPIVLKSSSKACWLSREVLYWISNRQVHIFKKTGRFRLYQ